MARARPGKRGQRDRKLAELCDARAKDLSLVESLDVGIPRTFSQKLSARALVKNLEYYASWTDKLYGEVVPMASAGALDYTVREPFGVVAAAIPWNTPLLFVGSKLGPALATGNTVILKPSERGSLAALRVAELVAEAGFPPGVIQIRHRRCRDRAAARRASGRRSRQLHRRRRDRAVACSPRQPRASRRR